MKKLFILIGVCIALSVQAQQFRSESFLNDVVQTNSVGTITNGTITFTNNFKYGGLTVSNGAAAPLGGFTNINSWLSTSGLVLVGTNCLNLSYTNANGVWVIITNNIPLSTSGISYVTNDTTQLVRDIPLWTDRNGQNAFNSISNTWAGDAGGNTYTIAPQTISLRMWGAASAATALNLIFVGLPDGINELTGANGSPNTFQWGVVPAAGVTVIATNFPSWKFAGCKSIRLRSATLTTATAANIQVTIQALNLNGFVP